MAAASTWPPSASLIETCKLCEVEPNVYLVYVITKNVHSHPNSQIDDLLPWAYTIRARAQENAADCIFGVGTRTGRSVGDWFYSCARSPCL